MQVAPKVSVVIPTHNRPELLRRALHSVLAQTYVDFEIIVIDDGDNEAGAEEVCHSFSDPRVRYIAQVKPHGGAPAARNRGVREARSGYVAFLDDDDEWLPYKLERQISVLASAENDIGFCFSAVINIYDDGREVKTTIENESNDFSEIALRRFNGFLTSTLMVRHAAFEEIGGFDETFPSHQEAELMIRLAGIYRGIGINEPLVRMSMSRQHDHIGSNMDRRIRGREMLLAKHAERYAAYPEMLARHKYWLAFMYRDAGKRKEALAAFHEAWGLHKRPLYALRYLAFRIFGR